MTLEKNPAIGSSWDDLQKTIFTKEEIAASELRVALMLEIIDARKKQGISQKKLEELSGVKQPVIARMEKGKTAPQLDTVLKILASLGKTLAVVPLDSHSEVSLGEDNDIFITIMIYYSKTINTDLPCFFVGIFPKL